MVKIKPAESAIAVFGGSFNPPHIVHTLAVIYVLSTYSIRKLLVIPAYRHPFGKSLAPYSHRLHMCKLAMDAIKHVHVSTIEEEMGGQCLTVDTLEELQERFPDSHLRLVIGSDILEEKEKWHRFDRILQIADPIILARQGHIDGAIGGPIFPKVSSTEIRHRIRNGLSTQGHLTLRVAEYIEQHQLYLTE